MNVPYQIIKSDRKTIAIQIKPDGQVVVKCPKRMRVEEARRLYGASAARDVEALLHENAALFAGGELSQDEKDAFFEAITQAYFASKSEAKRKFGHKE